MILSILLTFFHALFSVYPVDFYTPFSVYPVDFYVPFSVYPVDVYALLHLAFMSALLILNSFTATGNNNRFLQIA